MRHAFADRRLVLPDPYHAHGSSRWIAIGPKEDGEGHSVRPRPPRNRDNLHSEPMRFDMVGRHRASPHDAQPSLQLDESEGSPRTIVPCNGPLERMTRKIKDATVKSLHDNNHDAFRTQLADVHGGRRFHAQAQDSWRAQALRRPLQDLDAGPDGFILNHIHPWPGRDS